MFYRYIITTLSALFMFFSIQTANASFIPTAYSVSYVCDSVNILGKSHLSDTYIKSYDVSARYRVRKARGRALKYRRKS